jgi:hypothetical protein
MLAVPLFGTPTNPAGSVTVAATAIAALPLLVTLKLPVTKLPGPVHTSGSATEKLTRLTVTRKLHVCEPTLLVQVTVVVPTGKLVPEAGLQVIVPQLPLDVGAGYVTTAVAPVVPTVRSAGQVMVHVATVTVKVHIAVFCEASVAVQVTVVVPTWNVEPEAGLHEAVTPGQLSFGVGAG